MTRTLASQRGLSVVEASILMMLLILATTLLAPAISNCVVDAKKVKVTEDCDSIGIAVMRLVRDIGRCPRASYANNDCANVLYSAGVTGGFDWPAIGTSMEEQLVTNRHQDELIYRVPGWRGPYLPRLSSDPWGTRYGVNVRFLTTPDAGGDDRHDVICLSAGPNRRYETSFYGRAAGRTLRGGDDVISPVQTSQHPR